jgi:hypothetical protein
MKYEELPELTTEIGRAPNEEALGALLLKAVNGSDKPFIGFEQPTGGPQSIRIVYQEPKPKKLTGRQFTGKKQALSALELAKVFFGLTPIRRVEMEAKSPGMVKGWEVSTGNLDGETIVIVTARFVKPA